MLVLDCPSISCKNAGDGASSVTRPLASRAQSPLQRSVVPATFGLIVDDCSLQNELHFFMLQQTTRAVLTVAGVDTVF